MKRTRSWEQETLIKELKQGKELTEQLITNLDPLASEPESCEFLIQKIIASYDKALAMLKWEEILEGEISKSLAAAGASPKNEGCNRDLKDQCAKDVNKKRKAMLRWTKQVRICSETGLVSLEDGYSWRKYGQKDILGAHFPRAYYRCTHRHAQGCLATKQVQRSDGDPSVFEITYRGMHTCIQTSQSIPAPLASNGIASPELKKHHLEPLFNFQTNLVTETENSRKSVFLGSDTSPAILSPEIPESDFFSLVENWGWSQSLLPHSESDLSDQIVSAPSSVTNSPIGNYFDFSLDHVDFDPTFPFDTSELFS